MTNENMNVNVNVEEEIYVEFQGMIMRYSEYRELIEDMRNN